MPERQPVYVVCHGADVPTPPKARVFSAPGLGVGQPRVELAEPHGAEDARHRLDTAARTLAADDPFVPLVLVVGPDAARFLIAELTGVSTGSVALESTAPGAVTVIGMPRRPRTVGPWPVAVLALLLAIVDNLLWGCLGVPFVSTAVVAGASLLCVLVPRLRHWGFAGLKAVALGVLLTILVLSSAKRFPGA